MTNTITWPDKCQDCQSPEVEVALVSHSGKSPTVFMCRRCSLSFFSAVAMKSLSDHLPEVLKASAEMQRRVQ